jgi:hypothetical protein
MEFMFHNTKDFSQPIGEWNVFNVTNMSFMFDEAKCFWIEFDAPWYRDGDEGVGE